MSKFLRGSLLGAASVLSLHAFSARAQEMSADPNSIQGVVLDGIVVTSSKVSESAIEALAGSSAVDKETIDTQFQPDEISDVLRTIPGVTTQETGRDTAVAVNIRGLQDFGRVNVLVEGARQNFQRSGHSANGAFYIDPEMISSIDVTRGPTATIYGSGAIGGVAAFNLISADDILRDGEYAAIQSRGRYSSNGDGKLASQTGAVRVGNFDVVGQINIRENGNYEDGDGNMVLNSADDTDSKMVKARFRPADGHEITGTLVDYSSEFIDQLGTVQRDTVVDNRQYTLGYSWRDANNPLIDFSAKVYRNETGLDQTRLAPGSFFEPVGSRRTFNVETEGFDIYNTSRLEFGQIKVALTYGGDYFRDSVTTSDPIGSGDEFTPSGERTVFGTFAQSRLSFFEIVELIGAIRYDSYELAGGTVSAEDNHVSPKVTLAITPIQGLTVFGTWAEGFRAPAVTETLVNGVHPPPATFQLRPNPNLRPEVAQNAEVGINIKYDGVVTSTDSFRAKVVAFRNEIDDFIDQVTVPIAGPPPFNFALQYQNIASATIDGVELEAAYDARSWFASVSAHHIRGENDATGAQLISIPADQVALTVGVRALEERLVAGARARFVAERDDVPAGATVLATSAYTVLDLFADYKATDFATVNLNIDNVFDETYLQYLDAQNSPGLNARIGLTMRLGAK
jgi:hemoglobin/transferrin/lactoferrin receptor protein